VNQATTEGESCHCPIPLRGKVARADQFDFQFVRKIQCRDPSAIRRTTTQLSQTRSFQPCVPSNRRRPICPLPAVPTIRIPSGERLS